jgi:Fe-S oxidoreductase
MVGIEPSAILSFRDEYVDLADDDNLEAARHLAKYVYLLEEFIVNEANAGRINAEQFTDEKKTVFLHAHCQQKAVASSQSSLQALGLPRNYTVRLIPSGCCGMAGSFGYEKEHFDLSMKVAELVLLPAVRSLDPEYLLAAPGTSCRHQIKDGTGRKARHPAEILYQALI